MNAARAAGALPPAAAPQPPARKARRLNRRSLLRRDGFTEHGLAAPGPGRLSVTLRARGTIAKGARRVRRVGTYSVGCRLNRSGAGGCGAPGAPRFRPAIGDPVKRFAWVRLVE